MEDALNTVGKEILLRDRKRRREAAESAAESAAEALVRPVPATLDPVLNSDDFKWRVTRAIMEQCSDVNHLGWGATFLGRSTLGAFLVVQGVQPQAFGPLWGALLAACFHLVRNSYQGGAPIALRPEGLSAKTMSCICEKMGQGPSKDVQDDNVMMAARRWSRAQTTDDLTEAWDIVLDDPRARVALEGVLNNCRGANRLFNK